MPSPPYAIKQLVSQTFDNQFHTKPIEQLQATTVFPSGPYTSVAALVIFEQAIRLLTQLKELEFHT